MSIKSVAVTAGVVVLTLAVVHMVAPATVKSYLGIA
jgi:hypothetical protein